VAKYQKIVAVNKRLIVQQVDTPLNQWVGGEKEREGYPYTQKVRLTFGKGHKKVNSGSGWWLRPYFKYPTLGR
jgi:hypothetical protein